MDLLDFGSKAGLGALTLFPLMSEFQALEGFVPSQRRQWFIVLATIISIAIYVWVVFFIQSFRGLVWWMWGLVAAVLLLLFYVPLLFVEKEWQRAGQPKTGVYGGLIAVLLLLYIALFGAFTYAFNTANQLRTHAVYDGTLATVDTKQPLSATEITFSYGSGGRILTTTDGKGHFFKIVPTNDLASIRVRYGVPEAAGSYCQTWLENEFNTERGLVHYVGRCQ